MLKSLQKLESVWGVYFPGSSGCPEVFTACSHFLQTWEKTKSCHHTCNCVFESMRLWLLNFWIDAKKKKLPKITNNRGQIKLYL